jgi:hypothetical protein
LRCKLGGSLLRDDTLEFLLLQGGCDGRSQRSLELAGHDLRNMLRDCRSKLLVQQSRTGLDDSRNNAASDVGGDDLVESFLYVVGQSAGHKTEHSILLGGGSSVLNTLVVVESTIQRVNLSGQNIANSLVDNLGVNGSGGSSGLGGFLDGCRRRCGSSGRLLSGRSSLGNRNLGTSGQSV